MNKVPIATWLVAALASSSFVPRLDAAPLQDISGPVEGEWVAEGLAGPEGLAMHPLTSELYVAERAGGRVSVVRDGQAIPVIEKEWAWAGEVVAWAITPVKPKAMWSDPMLHGPGSIAFGPDGRLYVAESEANGRLLEFVPDKDGVYSSALAIPVPWMDRQFAWGDLRLSHDGDVYISGHVPGLDLLPFGSVLRRDPKGIWWVVDFGPFVQYSGLGLSRDDDILVVCESRARSVIWWDAVGKVSLGTQADVVDETARLDGAAVLWDGSIIMPVNGGRADGAEKDGAYLLRINPATRETSILASGFDEIGSVLVVPSAKELYVSDSASGRVAVLRPRPEALSAQYLLKRPKTVRKGSSILPPKQSEMVIAEYLDLLKEGAAPLPGKGVGIGDEEGSGSLTLSQFSQTMPTVSGKVTTSPAGGALSPDPVESIEFLIYYPSRVIRSTDMATPSLSFFSATRRSGKVEKTRVLLEGVAKAGRGSDWSVESENARVYVPLAVCNMEKEGEDTQLNISFLGLGIFEDYHLRIVAGSENVGTLLVDNPFGSQSKYDLHFAEEAEDGRVVRSVDWRGFEDKGEETEEKVEDLGWFQIGERPVASISTFQEQNLPKFKGVGEDLHRILEEKETQRRLGE